MSWRNSAARTAACARLAHVVRPLLGNVQHSRDVVLKFDSSLDNGAQVLVTSSGAVVLGVLLSQSSSKLLLGLDGAHWQCNNSSAAVFELIAHNVKEHEEKCGDGLTALVLMLEAGMKHCADFLPTQGGHCSIRKKYRVVTHLCWIRDHWLEKEFAAVVEKCWSISCFITGSERFVQQDIFWYARSLLSTKFQTQDAVKFSTLLADWVLLNMPKYTTEPAIACVASEMILLFLVSRLKYILKLWPVVVAAGASTDCSQILEDEVLLSRPLFHEHALRMRSIQDVCFLIVTSSLSARDFYAHGDLEEWWTKRCTDVIAKTGANLLLCAESLPKGFAGALRLRNIFCIDGVDMCELKILQQMSGAEFVVVPIPKSFTGARLGRATSLHRITLGGQSYCSIRGIQRPGSYDKIDSQAYTSIAGSTPGLLLIRAPSIRLGEEFEKALRKVIRTLLYWIKPYANSCLSAPSGGSTEPCRTVHPPFLVRGGGLVETACHVWCAQLAAAYRRNGQGEKARAFEVFSRMICTVSCTLAVNAEERDGYHNLMRRIAAAKLHQPLSYAGSNVPPPSLRELCSPPDRKLLTKLRGMSVESWRVKLAGIQRAITMLIQFLNIDGRILVKQSTMRDNSKLEHGDLRISPAININ